MHVTWDHAELYGLALFQCLGCILKLGHKFNLGILTKEQKKYYREEQFQIGCYCLGEQAATEE